MPTAGSERALFDPALDIASDRALGRAVAGQAAAMVVLWRGVLNDPWLEGFVLHRVAHGIALAAAAACAGLVFGPVIARARTWVGTLARTLALGVVGGVAARLVSTPIALLGASVEPGKSISDIVMSDLVSGVVLGLFAGAAIAPITLLHRRLRTSPALDFVPRFYLVAAFAFLVPCVLVTLMGPSRGTPTLTVAAFLGVLAARAGSRRRDWLARVGAGKVPGFRLDEVADEKEIAALPAFAGEALGARGVLLRAESDGAWLRVARVDPTRATEEARTAMRRAAVNGACVGIYTVFVCFVPVLVLLMAAGH